MEAYARALRQLPTIIADNGGFDGSELISSLRAAHAKGNKVRRVWDMELIALTWSFGVMTSKTFKQSRFRVRSSVKSRERFFLPSTV